MSSNITNEKAQNHIKNGGSTCPKCGSDNAYPTELLGTDKTTAFQGWECKDCYTEWQNIFKLVAVDIEDEYYELEGK